MSDDGEYQAPDYRKTVRDIQARVLEIDPDGDAGNLHLHLQVVEAMSQMGLAQIEGEKLLRELPWSSGWLALPEDDRRKVEQAIARLDA